MTRDHRARRNRSSKSEGWYVVGSNTHDGPYSRDELQFLADQKRITPESFLSHPSRADLIRAEHFLVFECRPTVGPTKAMHPGRSRPSCPHRDPRHSSPVPPLPLRPHSASELATQRRVVGVSLLCLLFLAVAAAFIVAIRSIHVHHHGGVDGANASGPTITEGSEPTSQQNGTVDTEAEAISIRPQPHDGYSGAGQTSADVSNPTTTKGATDSRPSTEGVLADAQDSGGAPAREDESAHGQRRSRYVMDGARFFGVEATGARFVYVVDASSSMAGEPFATALSELSTSVSRLSSQQQFSVVFFRTDALACCKPGAAPKMLVGGPKGLREASAWWDDVQAFGGTDPSEAIRIALGLRPDALFLLTDGEFPAEIQRLVREENRLGAQVHVVGFRTRGTESVLQAIARENSGQYRFIK